MGISSSGADYARQLHKIANSFPLAAHKEAVNKVTAVSYVAEVCRRLPCIVIIYLVHVDSSTSTNHGF